MMCYVRTTLPVMVLAPKVPCDVLTDHRRISLRIELGARPGKLRCPIGRPAADASPVFVSISKGFQWQEWCVPK